MRNFLPGKKSLASLVLAAACAQAAAGDRLLCTEQHTTGFAVGSWSKEWDIAKFENYKRFVLRPPTDAEREAQPSRVFMVSQEGKDFAIAECLGDFSAAGVLACAGEIDFLFNRENSRFQAYHKAGYAVGAGGQRITQDGQLTPYLSIGYCTAPSGQ